MMSIVALAAQHHNIFRLVKSTTGVRLAMDINPARATVSLHASRVFAKQWTASSFLSVTINAPVQFACADTLSNLRASGHNDADPKPF